MKGINASYYLQEVCNNYFFLIFDINIKE